MPKRLIAILTLCLCASVANMKLLDKMLSLVRLGEAGVTQDPILHIGYSAPVKQPQVAQSSRPANSAARADTSAYGATGTPIVSGFVTDLQEYNPILRGRPAFATYEQMRRSDADVAALLMAMKLPIRSAEASIIPAEDKPGGPSSLSKEIAEFVEDNLFGGLEYENALGMKSSQRFESVIENALLMIDFGCAGHEDLWTIDGGKVRLRRIAPRLPLTFYRFHVEPDGETLNAVEQWGYRGNDFVNVRVPADKFTLFTQHMEGANFYGISSLRMAYQPWYVKQALYRITSIAAERNSMGVPVLKASLNPSREDMDNAQTWVQNLSVNEQTSMVLPNGWEFMLQGISGRIYDPMPFIQHMSEQIVRSGLAMFMALGSSQTGSRALGNTMVDFFQMSLTATAHAICDAISQSTIRRLVDFNFSRDKQSLSGAPVPYPRLHIPHIAVLNPLDILATIKDVATANVDLLQPDDDLENHIRKQCGYPLKAKEARIRYAPVAQRIEGTETSPTAEEDAAPGAAKRGPQRPPQGGSAAPPQQQGGKPIVNQSQGAKKPIANGGQTQTQARALSASGSLATPAGRLLTRPLKAHERKHDFDGHAERADMTSSQVAKILRAAKPALIREAAARAASAIKDSGSVKGLDELQLPFPHAIVSRLARSLSVAHRFGHQAVYDERKKATGRSVVAQSSRTSRSAALADPKAAKTSALQDKPSLIAEASVSDLNNWLTSRARGAAVDNYKKGLTDHDLEQSIISDLQDGSDSFLDRIGDEAARSAVSGGRWQAFGELSDDIAKYARSEAMDHNTCQPCMDGDGTEWDSLDDVDWSPGDDCDGGDNCRGQLMPIFSDEGAVTTD